MKNQNGVKILGGGCDRCNQLEEAVRKALEDAGVAYISADVNMIPQNYVELTDENAIKCLQRTLDLLDEDDDVQAVYHNWDMPEDEEEE